MAKLLTYDGRVIDPTAYIYMTIYIYTQIYIYIYMHLSAFYTETVRQTDRQAETNIQTDTWERAHHARPGGLPMNAPSQALYTEIYTDLLAVEASENHTLLCRTADLRRCLQETAEYNRSVGFVQRCLKAEKLRTFGALFAVYWICRLAAGDELEKGCFCGAGLSPVKVWYCVIFLILRLILPFLPELLLLVSTYSIIWSSMI